MIKRINDADLLALVQACLDVCMTYGRICKEVRDELDCDLRKAIYMTDYGLTLAASGGSAVATLLLRERGIQEESAKKS